MKAFLTAIAFAVSLPAAAFGQAMGHSKMMLGNQPGMTMQGMLPRETGQSAFAAIQEIVAILSANPATDWSKVDVEALRQHLIDMNNVTLGAAVEAKQSGDSMQFVVSGEGPIRDSIKRMVLAHAATMNGLEGWSFVAETRNNGALLTVTPPDHASMNELRALGFIGILTHGMHHQQHHWMLANGMSPH